MRRTLAVLAVLLAALAVPAAARASFTVTPADTTRAGMPSEIDIHADFPNDPVGGPLRLDLPAGLVGNPHAPGIGECTEAQFQSSTCPASSQVGTASATTPLLPASGQVYNMAPQGDEPARLGIVVTGALLFAARNEASVTVRPDGGLTSTIASVQTALGQQINSLDLALDSDFMTLPTSCGPATSHLEAANNAPMQSSFTPTRCDLVPFTPSTGVAVANHARTQPTGATVTLGLPYGATPRQSHVRRAVVTLPLGTTLNPGVANGLQACSAGQFAGGGCPAASKIGSVSFATPLIGTLGGTVYFGQPAGGAYPLLVAVDDHGVHLRLTGRATLDQATGRITTVFDDLPQVPFTSFALTFQDGDRAVIANPGTCGSKALTATLTPWSGTAAKTVSASYAVTGCRNPEPFRPALAVSSTSTAAGRPAGALSITVSRPDGDQDVSRVETQLPPGLAGSLTGVPMCGDADAAAGTCPASTRLGSVSALVGSGGAPVPLAGTVYLTGPAEGGLAGLAIVIPGRVGPVDLGTVVVRAGLLLRSADGGVTVRTAALPRFVGGVPVSIRSLTLRLDRPGFAVNPSGCDARTVTALLTGSDGGRATATAPYQATDCAGLPFAPVLSARIAHVGPKGARRQPRVRTVITVPPGQSATQSASVRLPKRLALQTAAIKGICTVEEQQADACPANSIVGTVRAETPLLPVPLTGPVHIASVPGQVLPGLRLSLGGPVQLRLNGTLNLGSAITAVFDGIPDVPLSRFVLTFDAGGPVMVIGSPCTGSVLRFAGTLAGHNGTTASTPARALVTGCPATAKGRLRHGRLRVVARHGRDAKRLARVVVHLPRGLSVRRVRATHDGGEHAKATVHGRTITAKLRRAARATLDLRVAGRRHGRPSVTLTRTNGRRFTVRLR